MVEALREIRPCIKNSLRNFVFIRGLFLNRYQLYKGLVKISSYTQYMSIFVNLLKPLFANVITIININYDLITL